MATEIVRPGPAHNCLIEVNPHGHLFKELVLKTEEPIGLIKRCSCGTLWVTKHYYNSHNYWVRAGWLLRWKHRHAGWEGVKDESY